MQNNVILLRIWDNYAEIFLKHFMHVACLKHFHGNCPQVFLTHYSSSANMFNMFLLEWCLLINICELHCLFCILMLWIGWWEGHLVVKKSCLKLLAKVSFFWDSALTGITFRTCVQETGTRILRILPRNVSDHPVVSLTSLAGDLFILPSLAVW